jgi:hypothetical protein
MPSSCVAPARHSESTGLENASQCHSGDTLQRQSAVDPNHNPLLEFTQWHCTQTEQVTPHTSYCQRLDPLSILTRTLWTAPLSSPSRFSYIFPTTASLWIESGFLTRTHSESKELPLDSAGLSLSKQFLAFANGASVQNSSTPQHGGLQQVPMCWAEGQQASAARRHLLHHFRRHRIWTTRQPGQRRFVLSFPFTHAHHRAACDNRQSYPGELVDGPAPSTCGRWYLDPALRAARKRASRQSARWCQRASGSRQQRGECHDGLPFVHLAPRHHSRMQRQSLERGLHIH